MDAMTIVMFVVYIINMAVSFGNLYATFSSWGKYNHVLMGVLSKSQAEYYAVLTENCRNAVARKKKAEDAADGSDDGKNQE